MNLSDKLFEKACSLMPGGVNSPVRAFKSVGDSPRFILRAKGCKMWDVDGNEYIDYIGSWGPLIAGHAHPQIITALGEAAKKGSSFGASSPSEIVLAEEIINRVESVEKVRFVNSGTEATMSAVRLARAATGRDIIVKFTGCYHGHADSFLIQAGSGVATLGLPNSPGVTEGAARDTISLPYNDLESVEKAFNRKGDNIAAVIVEPVAGNMGVVPPAEGFLDGLRHLCSKYESILIFDEVMTGFRVSSGGAQKLYNVKPDLTTFGKIIGGGLPVGAYGGKRELMSMIAPEGPVYQAGTLSGNPLAMAAGMATLDLLDQKVYNYLDYTSGKLEAELKIAFEASGIPVTIQRVGSMLTLFFTDKPVRNFDDAQSADHKLFAEFFRGMLNNGVHLPPSGYEAWFVSMTHNDIAIEQTIDAVKSTLKKLK